MKWLPLLFLLSLPVIADERCREYADDCEYYSCVSEAKHCGDESYPISFGKRYCLRYESRMDHFTENGKIWINEVKKCLIDEMAKFEEDLTCSQLRKRAFKSHVPCYVKSGFCELSFYDKRMAIKTIWPSIRNVHILASGINTLRACY